MEENYVDIYLEHLTVFIKNLQKQDSNDALIISKLLQRSLRSLSPITTIMYFQHHYHFGIEYCIR